MLQDFIKVSAMVRHMSFGWAGMKFYIVAEQQVLIISCIAMSSQFGITSFKLTYRGWNRGINHLLFSLYEPLHDSQC